MKKLLEDRFGAAVLKSLEKSNFPKKKQNNTFVALSYFNSYYFSRNGHHSKDFFPRRQEYAIET